jgi:TctA family transporter
VVVRRATTGAKRADTITAVRMYFIASPLVSFHLSFYPGDVSRSIEVVVAIVCITILEALALYKGIDGSLFSLVIGAIAALGGYRYARARRVD